MYQKKNLVLSAFYGHMHIVEHLMNTYAFSDITIVAIFRAGISGKLLYFIQWFLDYIHLTEKDFRTCIERAIPTEDTHILDFLMEDCRIDIHAQKRLDILRDLTANSSCNEEFRSFLTKYGPYIQ